VACRTPVPAISKGTHSVAVFIETSMNSDVCLSKSISMSNLGNTSRRSVRNCGQASC